MDSSFVISKLATISMVLLFRRITTVAINFGRRYNENVSLPEQSMDVSEDHGATTGESMSIETNESSPKEDMSIEDINQETPGRDEAADETDGMEKMARMLNMSKTELDNVYGILKSYSDTYSLAIQRPMSSNEMMSIVKGVPLELTSNEYLSILYLFTVPSNESIFKSFSTYNVLRQRSCTYPFSKCSSCTLTSSSAS